MTRRILVIVHRYVGLATALFLLIVGFTGALLAYLEPLSALLSPELHHAPGRGAVLAPAALVARAQAVEPNAVLGGYALNLKEGRGVSLSVGGRIDPASGEPMLLGYDELWMDPVTGAVLGRVDSTEFPPTRHSLMSFVYRLHYQLAIPGSWGTWILGIVAILWFFDCFIGAVLTFPRGRPFLSKWKPAWGVKRRRLNYDLHRAGGLWPWLLLAVLALSSIYFNLDREVFRPVFSLIADTTPEPIDTRSARKPGDQLPPRVSAERAVALAADKASELHWTAQPQGLFHRAVLGFWQVYYEKPKSQWATAGGYALFIDDQSGEVIHVRAPGGTGGDVFMQWLSDLHVGAVLGWPYKLLLCMTGLCISMLSITGIVIWLRKRRARISSRTRVLVSGIGLSSNRH